MKRRSFESIAVLALSASVALAADWEFQPAVTLSLQDNSNAFLIVDQPQQDQSAALDLELAAARRTERDTLTLAYRPEVVRYQDLDGLNNVSHFLSAAFSRRATQRVGWDLSGTWNRRERATLSYDLTTLDLIALPPVQFDTFGVNVTATLAQSQRSRWRAGAFTTSTRYDEELLVIPSRSPSQPDQVLPLEDSDDVGVSVGFETDVSSRSHLRFEGRFNQIDEGARGQRDVTRALVGWSIGSEERWVFEASAGAAWSTLSADVDVDADGTIDGTSDDSATDTVGSIGLRGRVGSRGSLAATLGRDITHTLGTGGAALSDAASLSLRYPVGRFSQFSIAARLAEREPIVDPTATGKTETKAVRAEYRAAIGPRWAIVASGENVDQTADSGGALAVDYRILSLGIRWAPLADRR
jgi:hypothetical protein